MFGKKKKEKEAKLAAEQKPLQIEPDDIYLEAEIIPDDELDVEPIVEVDAVPTIEEATIGENLDEPIVEEASFSNEPDIEDITFDDVDDFNAKADIDVEALNSQIQLDEEESVEEDTIGDDQTLLSDIIKGEPEEVDDEIAEDTTSDEETVDESQEENEEVVYVVDGPDEDEEIVKPAKLIKLPHLVDYLLNSDPKPTKAYLMKYSLALASLYKKVDDADDKEIVRSCILKITNAMR